MVVLAETHPVQWVASRPIWEMWFVDCSCMPGV